MRYNQLGNTSLKVSELCLGTMTWGDQVSAEEAGRQIELSLEKGINFFDTAEVYAIPPKPHTYGASEEILGEHLKRLGKRSEVVIASKVVGASTALRWIRSGDLRLDRENLRAALEESLKRLKTDYIDLYQLHWPNRSSYHFGKYGVDRTVVSRQRELDSFREVLETLQEFIKEGKIRYCGLSNEMAWGTMHYLALSESAGLPRMVSIQNEYSLLCRLFDFELAEVALHENIGLLAWSPLAAGALSGKYLGGKVPADSRRARQGKRGAHRVTEAAEGAIKEYLKVAAHHSLDPCQMAISFVLSRPFVTSAILGATNCEQLLTDIESCNLELTEEQLGDIDQVFRRYTVPF